VSKKIILITGTDTGIGKTLFTALWLYHLRATGHRALAMKPFCSGGRGDVKLLQSMQRGELSDEEMNPFYFKEPLAPMMAARSEKRRISLNNVVEKVKNVQKKCDCLLIEGAGGLLVPLGSGFTMLNLIAALHCEVVVVARNRLGTINHTCLTMKALETLGNKGSSLVLMSEKAPDFSAITNQKALAELLDCVKIVSIPYLGREPKRLNRIKENRAKINKVLALLTKQYKLCPDLLIKKQVVDEKAIAVSVQGRKRVVKKT
jgi:dethiobiotin synthetase